MKPLSDRIAAANTLLAPSAVPHQGTLGRVLPEEDDATRFPFQRDRDRIIHTQAFRRLKGKTQVFVVGKGDHYRTRLTHTMEVAQISRDMARSLSLNEDLAECIALAHDLGHTPFGHAGEEAMREEMERHGMSYEHNEQSLRIVTLLEDRTKRYSGLNLNREILEGLQKHRTIFDQKNVAASLRGLSLEAQIVNLADEIAYTAHDTDDGLRAGLFRMNDLRPLPLFAQAEALSKATGTEVRGQLIHLLVADVYEETERRLQKQDSASFTPKTQGKLDELRAFLWKHLYQAAAVQEHAERGKEVVRLLFRKYEAAAPDKVRALQRKTGSTSPEAIKDYIAGMTDAFAEAMACDKGGSL